MRSTSSLRRGAALPEGAEGTGSATALGSCLGDEVVKAALAAAVFKHRLLTSGTVEVRRQVHHGHTVRISFSLPASILSISAIASSVAFCT